MGGKKNKTTIALLFVLFFLTIFLHNCVPRVHAPDQFVEFDPLIPEFSLGFPFTYAYFGESFNYEVLQIIWWALFLNILLFIIIYKFSYLITENSLFHKYTLFLIWFHVIFSLALSLSYLLGPLLTPFPESPGLSIFLSPVLGIFLLIIGILIMLASKRKKKEYNETREDKLLRFSIAYLFLGVIFLIISIFYLSSLIILTYFLSLGMVSLIFPDTELFSKGGLTFMALWLPFFFYVIYQKKKNKSNEDSANNYEKKSSLKSKK